MSYQKKHKIYRDCIKRTLDITLSLLAILFLSPLFLFLYFLVKSKLGSPVLFKQVRPGLNEKIFTMFKFRTMRDEKDGNGNQLPDSERLTSFGKWLRSSSMDELPELFNILKGDMSIVGPRPLLVQYLPLYDDNQKRRHEVRPGLTGLAQVNGRNAISWEDKFQFDIVYVDSVSVILDIKIVFLTFKKIIDREGISSTSSETMEYFTKTEKGE